MDTTQAQGAAPTQELLERAIEKHRAGDLGAAKALYDQILGADPDHADALHFAGVLAHNARQSELAAQMILRSLEIAPNNPAAFNNLGNVMIYLDQPQDAADCYMQALGLDPGNADALTNVGFIRIYNKQYDKAIECLNGALEIDADHPTAHKHLSRVLRMCGRTEEALDVCRERIGKQPDQDAAYLEAAYCLSRLGREEEIRELFSTWARHASEGARQLHHWGAMLGGDVPDRANDDYVAGMFDGYADSFDRSLGSLGYQAPQHVQAEFERRFGTAVSGLEVLDAGCGTGLMGPTLRPLCKQLEGVDLSTGMLAHAARRECYDKLHAGELTAFIQERPDRYDGITCADTFCYFGRLEEAFCAMFESLRPGGHLVFTVEHDPRERQDIDLQFNGRYRHAESYVRDALAGAGFRDISLAPQTLRMEFGDPVPGLVVGAQRPASH